MLASALRSGCLRRVSAVACTGPSAAAKLHGLAASRSFASASRRQLIVDAGSATSVKPSLWLPRAAARRIQHKAEGSSASTTIDSVAPATSKSAREAGAAGSADAVGSRAASAAEASAAASEPKVGRLRRLIRDYGYIALGIHLSVYLATLGSLFAALEADILKAGDARSWLKNIGADRFIDLEKVKPSAGNFALAWILAKFTEPMRLFITATVTPRLAVVLRGAKAAATR